MIGTVEDQLKFQNAFQNVLITLATRFINYPVDQMDSAITEALRQIVEFLGAMRASINQTSVDGTEFSQLYRWSPPDHQRVFPERIPLADYARIIPQLERGESIYVRDRDELPHDSELRGLLGSLGIVAVIVMPIIRNSSLFGFVSTSWDTPKEIRSEILDLLRFMSEIFVNAIERKQNEDRIRKANEDLEQRVEERTRELRELNQRLQAEISEREEMETALRANEERYRNISQVISDYAFQYGVEPDGSLKLEWATFESYFRLTGYTQEDIGQPFRRYHPDDEALARQDVLRTLSGEPTEREYRSFTKNGDERWIYMRRYPVWDEQLNRVVRFYGAAQDITERKRIEEALRHSEEMFRATFEQAAVGIAHVAPDGRWLRVNQRLCEIVGYSPTDMLTRTFQDITHDDDLETDMKYVGQMLSGEIQNYSMNKRYLHKTGKIVWANLTVSLVRDANGQPDYFVSVIEDITALKAAQLELMRSEERYRIVSELISDFAYLYRVEPDGALIAEWATEDSYIRATGFALSEIGGTYRLYHPDDISRSRQDVEHTLQGEPTEGEYRIITKNGETRWLYIRRFPVWDKQHKRVDRFYGVAQNITERKRVEEAAWENQQRLELALEAGELGIWDWNLQADTGSYSATWAEMLGYTLEEIEQMHSPFEDLVHPDDFHLAARLWQDHLHNSARIYQNELRMRTRSGEWNWILSFGKIVAYDLDGKPVRAIGVHLNITDRKRIEAEERAHRILAEALLDTAHALNTTLHLEEVLDRIFANIERVIHHYEGAIMLVEGPDVTVVRAKEVTVPGWAEAVNNLRFPIATTPNLYQVFKTGQPLIISDVRDYPGWMENQPYEWIRCHALIPIQQETEVIGFFSWESPIPDSFTPEMLTSLQMFADQTAIALKNAQLYEQAQELAMLQERQRLARDLHDAVTQTMFSASMIAETLVRLWDRNPEQIRKGLEQLRFLTRGAVAEMRALLLELRPEALEAATLPQLVAQLTEAFTGRTGIAPHLVAEGDRVLPMEVKLALYRIAQEALNNISKHARATAVRVHLTINHMIKLAVSDNGRGFTREQAKAGSFGLKIMRERAEQIGARIAIESEPGKSTTITVEWTG